MTKDPLKTGFGPGGIQTWMQLTAFDPSRDKVLSADQLNAIEAYWDQSPATAIYRLLDHARATLTPEQLIHDAADPH